MLKLKYLLNEIKINTSVPKGIGKEIVEYISKNGPQTWTELLMSDIERISGPLSLGQVLKGLLNKNFLEKENGTYYIPGQTFDNKIIKLRSKLKSLKSSLIGHEKELIYFKSEVKKYQEIEKTRELNSYEEWNMELNMNRLTTYPKIIARLKNNIDKIEAILNV